MNQNLRGFLGKAILRMVARATQECRKDILVENAFLNAQERPKLPFVQRVRAEATARRVQISYFLGFVLAFLAYAQAERTESTQGSEKGTSHFGLPRPSLSTPIATSDVSTSYAIHFSKERLCPEISLVYAGKTSKNDGKSSDR